MKSRISWKFICGVGAVAALCGAALVKAAPRTAPTTPPVTSGSLNPFTLGQDLVTSNYQPVIANTRPPFKPPARSPYKPPGKLG